MKSRICRVIFIRVITVGLDTMQVLHHVVAGLSLLCSKGDHHRYPYKLINNGENSSLQTVKTMVWQPKYSVGPVFTVRKMPFFMRIYRDQ